MVAQHPSADAPDQRCVAAQKRRQRSVVPAVEVVGEQLSVGQPRPVVPEHGTAEPADGGTGPAGCHVVILAGWISPHLITTRTVAVDAFCSLGHRSHAGTIAPTLHTLFACRLQTICDDLAFATDAHFLRK